MSSRLCRPRLRSRPTADASTRPGLPCPNDMPGGNAVPWGHLGAQGQPFLPLQDDQIHYAGQPIALVVAATLDQATYAGTLIKASYETHSPRVFDLRTAKEDAV